MNRWLTAAVALAVAASIAATLGAAATKPYSGSWKAKVTADQLLKNGIAQLGLRGTWRLEFHRDGTYRMFTSIDKLKGAYSANATRIVLSKDSDCLAGGLKGPGVYRWSVKADKLKLTTVRLGGDPCGFRWQIASIPLWTRT